MKKTFLGLAILILPLLSLAQPAEEPGIRFVKGLNWDQLKAKAKAENKFIFIDCYATWCGPCKLMDKIVYPVDSIGQLVNHDFLSVKVQMDSTVKDDDEVKSWYRDARLLNKEYKITALPTFLFFSPEGKLIHKSVGYKAPGQFTILVRNSLNPQRQFYTLKDQFQEGKRDFPNMAYLTNTARMLGDTATANMVYKIYISDYLLHLNEPSLYTPDNLRFMAALIKSSDDKTFNIFYAHGAKVDGILKTKGFSLGITDNIIEKEEINSRIYKDGKPFQDLVERPDWNGLTQLITNKYNQKNADRIVQWAKIKWLENKQYWAEYTKNVMLKVQQYGPYVKYYPYNDMGSIGLNMSAWEICSYSVNRKELETALSWAHKVITTENVKNDPYYPAFLDTYANLLYKLGRKKEALSYEEKATGLSPNAKDIKQNLANMKQGKRTWAWPNKEVFGNR